MLNTLIHTLVGSSIVLKHSVEEELKNLEKQGRIKKSDVKNLLKTFEEKGKAEDKRVKKQLKKLIKELINELGLVTKKDLKRFKEELKDKS